jgi:hypothetical protein
MQEDTMVSYVSEKSSMSGERRLTTTKSAQGILDICLRTLTNIYVVIDGLDECKPGEKRAIVSWFKRFSDDLQNAGIAFKCLFLSQNDEETNKLVRGATCIQLTGDGLFRDIRTFCGSEFKKIQEKLSLEDEEVERMADKVAKEAKGICQSLLSRFVFSLTPE